MKNKIWGLTYKEIFIDGDIYWETYLKRPFFQNGHWNYGLNLKFLETALNRSVKKLILKIGEKEIIVDLPNKAELKRKEKLKEFEDRPSLFEGSPPMRIFHFTI